MFLIVGFEEYIGIINYAIMLQRPVANYNGVHLPVHNCEVLIILNEIFMLLKA